MFLYTSILLCTSQFQSNISKNIKISHIKNSQLICKMKLKPYYLAKNDIVWSWRAYTTINHLKNNTSSKNSLCQITSTTRSIWSGLAATGRGWRRRFFLGNRHQRSRFDSVFPILARNWTDKSGNLGFIALSSFQ